MSMPILCPKCDRFLAYFDGGKPYGIQVSYEPLYEAEEGKEYAFAGLDFKCPCGYVKPWRKEVGDWKEKYITTAGMVSVEEMERLKKGPPGKGYDPSLAIDISPREVTISRPCGCGFQEVCDVCQKYDKTAKDVPALSWIDERVGSSFGGVQTTPPGTKIEPWGNQEEAGRPRQIVLPGKYAFVDRLGDREQVYTFQEAEEFEAFLKSRDLWEADK